MNNKYINKGAYGCVYLGHPLNSKKSKIKLVKILINEKDYVKEVRYTNKFNSLDNLLSTIKIEDIFVTDIKEIGSDEYKIISECEFDDNKTFYQIVYNIDDYGVVLDDYEGDIKIILKLYVNLFESLLIFIENELAHNDIKSNNIVYIKKKNKLAFIDFGLSYVFKDLFGEKYHNFDIFYLYYHAPEYTLMTCLYKNIDKKGFIKEFLKAFIADKFNQYIIPYYKDYIIDLSDLYDFYYNKYKKTNNLYELITNEDKEKLDLYSLGLTLFELYKIHHMDNEDLLKIILKIVKFNNKKRINIYQAIVEYKKFLSTYQGRN